jgi:hypothetical protein
MKDVVVTKPSASLKLCRGFPSAQHFPLFILTFNKSTFKDIFVEKKEAKKMEDEVYQVLM